MKKILSILMIMVLVLGLLVGCWSKEEEEKTAQELFEIADEKSKEITNAEFDSEFNIELEGSELAMGLAAPMGIKMSGKIADEKNIMISLDIDTGQGMTFKGDIYVNEEVVLIHAPILASFLGSEYIKMDMETLSETSGIDMTTAAADQEKIKEMVDNFAADEGYSIMDIFTVSDTIEEVELTINDEAVDTKKLVATVNTDKAIELALAFLDYISENEEAQSILFANLTQEEIDEALAQLNSDEVRASIDEFVESVTFNNFEYIVYVNEDTVPVKHDFDLDMTIDSEAVSMDIKLNGFFTLFNIGGVEEIILPEVDETEVLDLNDLY